MQRPALERSAGAATPGRPGPASPPALPRSGARPALVPPAWRLAVTFLFIVAVTLLPRRPHVAYWIPAAILVTTWLFVRMPIRVGLKRLLVAEFFIVGLALLSLFSPSAAPIFLSAFLKSNLCVLALILLTWSTPFYEILLVLRRLRVPPILLTTIALMYRYLPVISGEAQRMQRARASRTFSNRRFLAWSSLGTVIAQLFVRCVTRGERIYLAMCARGWK